MPTGSGQRRRDRTWVANPRQYLARTLHFLSRPSTWGRHREPASTWVSARAAVAMALTVMLGLLGLLGGGLADEPAKTDSASGSKSITRDGQADRGSDERASRRDRPENRNAKTPPDPATKAKPAPPKAKPKPKRKSSWVAPTSNFRVSSGYGARWGKTHRGLDFAAPMGTKIVSANPGVVAMARPHGGYGNAVVVSHGHGIRTLYAHNSKLLVKPGQRVKAGQPIALLGSTGHSTGPHLHFEVHHNNHAVDPRPWMAERGLHF